MERMKRAMAIGLLATMMSPSVAGAAAYPRQISIEGMDCIEKIGAEGQLETWCQTGEQMQLVSVDPAGPPARGPSGIELPPRSATQTTWSGPDPAFAPRSGAERYSLANHYLRSPYAAAQVSAQQHAHADRYFRGGFAGGFFLGPIGWLVTGLFASTSDVYIPTSLPDAWTTGDHSQFMFTYTNEVRSKRTTNAILGGICGTIVSGLLVYAIVSSSD